MRATERLRTSIHHKTIGIKTARAILISLTFAAFLISGLVEHGVTVALVPSAIPLKIRTENDGREVKETKNRKYCDPPNMTALAIYYDSSEETDPQDDYYYSQLQEMFFQANLSHHEKMELILKKSYLWGTLVSPIPASLLAVRIGPKKTFGYSILGVAASTMMVPAAWLTTAHVAIRFMQGLFNGALIPPAHSLAVNWFPLCRRSSFISLYSAKYVGYALCELLTDKVIHSLGTGSAYYVISLLAVIWFAFWSTLVFNTQDKYLEYCEREKSTVPQNCTKSTAWKFPFKYFICSRPVWMSAGAITGAEFAQIGINVGMRLYLKYVYDVSDVLLLVIPYIMHTIFALICGHLIDYIQAIRFVSITSSRRMFVYISHFIPAGLLFVIGYVGCDSLAPTFLYSIAVIASGAVYSGAIGSTMDLAPKYAGIIVAFCCTFGASANIIMTYLIANVLNGEVLGSWRLTFSLTSLILLVSSIFFMLRGSGAIQYWNNWSSDDEKMMARTAEGDMESRHSILAPLPVKSRAKSIYMVEKKILKVLHVQEPEKFKRVRAYSTSLANYRLKEGEKPNVFCPSSKKRASIT